MRRSASISDALEPVGLDQDHVVERAERLGVVAGALRRDPQAVLAGGLTISTTSRRPPGTATSVGCWSMDRLKAWVAAPSRRRRARSRRRGRGGAGCPGGGGLDRGHEGSLCGEVDGSSRKISHRAFADSGAYPLGEVRSAVLLADSRCLAEARHQGVHDAYSWAISAPTPALARRRPRVRGAARRSARSAAPRG